MPKYTIEGKFVQEFSVEVSAPTEAMAKGLAVICAVEGEAHVDELTSEYETYKDCSIGAVDFEPVPEMGVEVVSVTESNT